MIESILNRNNYNISFGNKNNVSIIPFNTKFSANYSLPNNLAFDTFVKSSKSQISSSQNATFPCANEAKQAEIILNTYLNSSVIKKAIQTNPEIEKILASEGLKPICYMANIIGEDRKHFESTYTNALKIAKKKNISQKDLINLKYAALLHDIGKSLIPTDITHKNGALTPHEREIIDLHSELGAQILKTVQFPSYVDKNKVIEMVRLHHTPIIDNSNKYSKYDVKEKANNELAQILSVSDVYSALSEKRSYKEYFALDKTREIMLQDCKNGKLSPTYTQLLFNFD